MRNISNKPILNRIGTPTDTDVSTDLANIQTEVDKIGTPADADVSTDIANLDTKIGTPTDTDIATDIANVLAEASKFTVNMWFVDASVGSSGDGTSLSEAFQTITEAEDARSAGDYVLIVPGTYDENTVAGGLVIAKDKGNFVTLGDSFESIIINNSHGSATDVVTVSGDSNNFYGIMAVQAGINAWNITGVNNSFDKSSGNNSGVGFKIGADADKTFIKDCRSTTCTTSVEIASEHSYLSNLTIDSSTTGIKVLSGANLTSIKNSSVIECTTGYQFDNGSLLSSLINCSGDNTTNITDNSGAGNLSIIDFNTPSELTSGNSIQEDIKEIDTLIGTPADTDVSTDLANIKTEVDKIGTPADTDVSTDIANVQTEVDKIDTLLATTPRIVERTAETIPDTTQTPYFTVSGRVLVTQIVGEVTTVVSGTATDIKLVANPTVGVDVDLCTALTITSDAVGTMYNITGDFSDAMVATTSGAFTAQSNGIIVADGTIDLDSTATQTGATKWTLHYIPLDSGSTVVVA